MKAIICECDERPVVKDIDTSLDSLQKIVGGYIEFIYPFDDNVAIVCNEEGKLQNLPLNKWLTQNGVPFDPIVGNILVVGLGEEDICSLTDEQVLKYTKLFMNDYIEVE